MRKTKDILRLHLLAGVTSCRQIGRAAGCGKTAVAECLRRAAAVGLGRWEEVEALDEEALERRLYPAGAVPAIRSQRPLPDWARIREELARRDHHVTLALLWSEYKAEHPAGYQYSQFAELYRRFERRLSVVLRQTHRPGEKCFVDFCDGQQGQNASSRPVPRPSRSAPPATRRSRPCSISAWRPHRCVHKRHRPRSCPRAPMRWAQPTCAGVVTTTDSAEANTAIRSPTTTGDQPMPDT